jgi:hypothetical protein
MIPGTTEYSEVPKARDIQHMIGNLNVPSFGLDRGDEGSSCPSWTYGAAFSHRPCFSSNLDFNRHQFTVQRMPNLDGDEEDNLKFGGHDVAHWPRRDIPTLPKFPKSTEPYPRFIEGKLAVKN